MKNLLIISSLGEFLWTGSYYLQLITNNPQAKQSPLQTFRTYWKILHGHVLNVHEQTVMTFFVLIWNHSAKSQVNFPPLLSPSTLLGVLSSGLALWTFQPSLREQKQTNRIVLSGILACSVPFMTSSLGTSLPLLIQGPKKVNGFLHPSLTSQEDTR